jgi:gluconolactonase
MRSHARSFVATLGALACIGYIGAAAASDAQSSRHPAHHPRPPGEVIPTEIYDPLGLVARGSRGELVSLQAGFSFTEGPAADRHGNVFFTDQPNDRIYRWDAGINKVTLWLEGTGRANGMIFDRHDNLIAAADLHGELWKIRPDGSHTVLIDNYEGKLLNGPNDVWINPVNGGIYITDPIFPRDYWDAGDPRQQPWEPTHSEQSPQGKGGHVYYLPPGANKLVRVTSDALGWESDSWPNGVVGTPDGKKLYVNKWYYDNHGGTWVFDINRDGTLKNMRKFSDWGGDGMSMDELGNVYISNGTGVMAFDPDGNNVLRIPIAGVPKLDANGNPVLDSQGKPVTESGATNNTFAGRDGKTLFITGPVSRITSIRMNVRGAKPGRCRD